MAIRSWIRRQFKGQVSITDTIPAGLSAGGLSFTAADGSTFPDGSVGPFIITVDQGLATEENILIDSRSGAVFTVDPNGRGYNGGSGQVHGTNAPLFHTMNQQDLDEANQVAVQTLGAISASGDLLQGSAANTLVRLARGANSTFLTVQGTSLGYQAFGSGGTTAIAASGSDGVSVAPARYDHTHSGVTTLNGAAGAVTAVPTFNGSAAAVVFGSGGTTAIAAAGADGTSGNPARYDHTHSGVATYNGNVGAVTGPQSGGTTSAGIALVNGPQTFLSITTPNDGKMHAVVFNGVLIVTSNQTGGGVQANYTQAGVAQNSQAFAGNAVGTYNLNNVLVTVDPNTTVSLTQWQNLTGGAAKFYGSIIVS